MTGTYTTAEHLAEVSVSKLCVTTLSYDGLVIHPRTGIIL